MPSQNDSDPDDPWTFFGQFGRVEIDGATRLLAEAMIEFEVKEVTLDSDSKWSGPFALWIRDESAPKASALLVPYFGSVKILPPDVRYSGLIQRIRLLPQTKI